MSINSRSALKSNSPSVEKARRKKSELIGRSAEYFAALYLQIFGYKIIARREKTPFGEIDLIARKGRLLVFIEVKYRREKENLTSSLTPKSQQRIVNAARFLTSRRPKFQKMEQRFDLVFAAPLGPLPLGFIKHIKDAWRAY